jgi:eukaryotic-like serine/threonine-protein kinase
MKDARWREVSQIYFQALELPESDREIFLRTCKDEGLRQEVLSLLADETMAKSFLERPALEISPGFEIKKKSSLIGRQFGSYHILSELGRGGMGEVYRAKDQKLGRNVAIKVLPEEFAKDVARIARFQREAKLLAYLNHPNIAAIYGFEEFSGTNFLVLELVEGETLADRIRAGAIPVEEALKLAFQIAEALEAAHEKGVIHRDLKPANIKVTPEGKVKVLDFGLAKAFAGEQADLNPSNSPTLTLSPMPRDMATQQGVILGTVAYMSPEQARGKPADKRADIWAFGCVLFEMLTGRAPFSGDDVSEILAAVIRAEPEWVRLPANLHLRLRETIERCLMKDARNRYHDISDVRIDIQKVMADPSGVLAQPAIAAVPERNLRLGLPWIAAIAILSIIIGGVSVWKFKQAEPPQVVRLDYELPRDQEFGAITYLNPVLAVSPDGKQFVYSTPKGLYLRSLDDLTAKLISGTEGGAYSPFFSPDSKWVGYVSNGLKKIAVRGGAPRDLCDVSNAVRGAWWDEDNIITYSQYLQDIMQISADGGMPKSIVKLKSGSLYYPQILPDGKSIIYTSITNSAQPKIMVQSLKSGEPKELFTGFAPRYIPTGHIIYLLPRNNTLYAVQFDLPRLKIKGEPVPVLEHVMQYAVSGSGTLAYIPAISAPTTAKRTLVWVDRDGKEEPLSAPSNDYADIRISPDGMRVALQVNTPKSNIWIYDLAHNTIRPLTFDEGRSGSPLWTHDSKRVLYAWDRENMLLGGVYWKASDGTGEAEKLASLPGRGLHPYSFSKDGKSLALWEVTLSPFHWDIGILSMEGDHPRRELLHGEKYDVKEPRISPNGRWISYASNESGKYEVYVCPFPDVKNGKWQVSTSGGNHPLWSPDGRELFYNNGNATMAVPVETDPQFRLNGSPTVLFRGTAGKYIGPASFNMTDFTCWDISHDGKRFLMMKDDPTAAPRKINLVLDWFEELKQRVPVK